MNRFHSTAKVEISFELGGYRHAMDPGDEIEIPATHAYLVSARGLPLAAGPSPVAGAKPARSEPVVTPRPAPLAPRAPDEDDAVDGERDPDLGVDDGAPSADLDAQIAAAAAGAGRAPPKPRRPRG